MRAPSVASPRAKRALGSSDFGSTEAARRELSNGAYGSPFEWLMAAAWVLAVQQPARRPALSEETFIAAQWVGRTSAVVATFGRQRAGGDYLAIELLPQTGEVLRILPQLSVVWPGSVADRARCGTAPLPAWQTGWPFAPAQPRPRETGTPPPITPVAPGPSSSTSLFNIGFKPIPNRIGNRRTVLLKHHHMPVAV